MMLNIWNPKQKQIKKPLHMIQSLNISKQHRLIQKEIYINSLKKNATNIKKINQKENKLEKTSRICI